LATSRISLATSHISGGGLLEGGAEEVAAIAKFPRYVVIYGEPKHLGRKTFQSFLEYGQIGFPLVFDRM
jgi:hypothetical protein